MSPRRWRLWRSRRIKDWRLGGNRYGPTAKVWERAGPEWTTTWRHPRGIERQFWKSCFILANSVFPSLLLSPNCCPEYMNSSWDYRYMICHPIRLCCSWLDSSFLCWLRCVLQPSNQHTPMETMTWTTFHNTKLGLVRLQWSNHVMILIPIWIGWIHDNHSIFSWIKSQKFITLLLFI
jgi:hypothetical protein